MNDYSKRIDALLQETTPRLFNGVVLIYKDNHVVYENAIGYTSIEDKTELKGGSLFRIQSNTKQMTAVLILKAHEQGLIHIDDFVRKYFRDSSMEWPTDLTIRHLLNMSSGIAGFDEPLLFKPGTAYHYSNPSYTLLGRILEQVYARPFSDTIDDLLTALGMMNSYCFDSKRNDVRLVKGHLICSSKPEQVDIANLGKSESSWRDYLPTAGVISCAQDLHIWDEKLHNGQILQKDAYTQLLSCQVYAQHDTFGPMEVGYGMGLRVDETRSYRVIGHAGKGLGFTSLKFYVPEKDLDVIILENVQHEDKSVLYYFENKIREIVLASSLVV